MLCKRIGEVEVLFSPFLISVLDKGGFRNSRPGRFTSWRECPLRRRLGGFHIHSELRGEEKMSCRCWGLNAGPSWTLYRLSYFHFTLEFSLQFRLFTSLDSASVHFSMISRTLYFLLIQLNYHFPNLLFKGYWFAGENS
jgi:hypothetical protein